MNMKNKTKVASMEENGSCMRRDQIDIFLFCELSCLIIARLCFPFILMMIIMYELLISPCVKGSLCVKPVSLSLNGSH